MFLVCGLGNKGSGYSFTRHNMGYLVIDRFSEKFHIPVKKKVCNCIVGIHEHIILAKPDTFMNISGVPVSSLAGKMGIIPEEIIIIHDDLDMEFGKLRIKQNGGDGGHRGVRSVIDAFQSRLFYRVKIGIGRSPLMTPEDYVLSCFKEEERDRLIEALDNAVDAIHTFVFESKEKAMSMYNKKDVL